MQESRGETSFWPQVAEWAALRGHKASKEVLEPVGPKRLKLAPVQRLGRREGLQLELWGMDMEDS